MQDSTSVVAKNVADVLDVLAARFGSTAEHLWAVLVKQSVVDAWQTAIGALFVLGVVIGLVLTYRWAGRRPLKEWALSADRGAVRVLCTVGALIGGGVFFGLSSGIVGRLINPEFYALQYVLGQVR